MLKYKYIIIVLLIFGFTSCNAIFDRIFLSRPGNTEFKYYQKEKNPIIDSKLEITAFYYRVDSGVYSYLAFKSDGTVILFDHTSMVPDTVNAFTTIMNPRRKRNKRPKDLHDDFGFFITKKDSIFFTIHQAGVLGSHKIFEYKGIIKTDSLLLSHKNIRNSEFMTEHSVENKLYVYYRN